MRYDEKKAENPTKTPVKQPSESPTTEKGKTPSHPDDMNPS